MEGNVLYFGDNLQILREHVDDESVDLIYLDPPFNSNQSYNILFREENGTNSAAQVHAFEDTWHWNVASEEALSDIFKNATPRVVDMTRGFLSFLGRNQFTSYLVMMTPRLLELHRVLRETGSIYLHCDHTASHYLKILLDSTFGLENYRNEIVWKRSNPKSHTSQNFPTSTDTIFRYTKSNKYLYHQPYGEHDPDYVEKSYKYSDENGRYRLLPLLNPNDNRPNLTYEFLGVTRVWRWTRERMQKAYEDGIVMQLKPGSVPQYKKYLHESKGRTVTNLWDDITPATGNEALGYPTQKPEALLERIIKASSNEGDVLLDPFCGCGTTITVAERLDRRWIGIDITHLAIALMKNRLEDTFGAEVSYEVVGEPLDLSGARALAKQDRYQFQWWAISLVRARPVDQKKKGADKGVDGVKYIDTTPFSEKRGTIKVVVQVKSGHIAVKDIREFRTVVEDARAQMGAFLTLENPTHPMIKEALAAGYYKPNVVGAVQCQKIQILTIKELLNGKKLQTPIHEDITFKRANRAREKEQEHPDLFSLT